MHFRNPGEPIAPARFRNVSGPLLAFVAFSLLVHAIGFLFPTENIVQLPESRFGSTMISAVLTPIKNTPAAATSPSSPAPAPAKKPATKPAGATPIIHQHDASAINMVKASPMETTDPAQNKSPETKRVKDSFKTENSHLENTQSKSAQSSSDTPASELRQKQQEQQRNYLLGEIQNRLARYLSYPLRARKRGWQGEVMLTFHVNKSGQLNNVRLAKSSGYSLLDRSALNAISKLKHFAVPDGMGRPQAIDLQLPVQFKLYES